MKKKCSHCNISKSLDKFSKCKKHADGLAYVCKECKSAQDKAYREKNADKVKKTKKKYYEENKKEISKQQAEYYRKNSEKVKKRTSEYAKNNRRSVNKWFRKYHSIRQDGDPQYRLSRALRSRINRLVKSKGTKAGSAVRDLGCSIEDFVLYLESQFVDGMTWDNYGEWHIDHIIPLARFDLTDREQFLEAYHYTNLQPLWAKDNISKGSKMSWER